MNGNIFGSRLLLIDDDAAIGRSIKKVAEDLGFEVVTTTDPRTFLKEARTWRPTVVILDLQPTRKETTVTAMMERLP